MVTLYFEYIKLTSEGPLSESTKKMSPFIRRAQPPPTIPQKKMGSDSKYQNFITCGKDKIDCILLFTLPRRIKKGAGAVNQKSEIIKFEIRL